MSRIGIAAATFALVLAACGDDTPAPSNRFTATMNNANEVPASPNPNPAASGTATFTVDGGIVEYVVSYSNMSGRPTNAHIHAGTGTVAGTPAVLLSGFPTAAGATSGSWDGSFGAAQVLAGSGGNVTVTAGDLDSLLSAMRAGNTYTNLHTSSNPNGEIRGQNQPQ